jgi:hypothetical protein
MLDSAADLDALPTVVDKPGVVTEGQDELVARRCQRLAGQQSVQVVNFELLARGAVGGVRSSVHALGRIAAAPVGDLLDECFFLKVVVVQRHDGCVSLTAA